MIFKDNKLDIYGKKLVKIPTPYYFVLYNGTRRNHRSCKAVFGSITKVDTGKGKHD
jgi:hypothetical protein